jgi:hypothetical protein
MTKVSKRTCFELRLVRLTRSSTMDGTGISPFDSLRQFLGEYAGISTMATAEAQEATRVQRDAMGGCFDLSGQLPAGRNATISSGDWSGTN